MVYKVGTCLTVVDDKFHCLERTNTWTDQFSLLPHSLTTDGSGATGSGGAPLPSNSGSDPSANGGAAGTVAVLIIIFLFLYRCRESNRSNRDNSTPSSNSTLDSTDMPRATDKVLGEKATSSSATSKRTSQLVQLEIEQIAQPLRSSPAYTTTLSYNTLANDNILIQSSKNPQGSQQEANDTTAKVLVPNAASALHSSSRDKRQETVVGILKSTRHID
ncbi:hypothetical protein BGX27_006845 [Mortierella sp. AM989]|nr:hypothetical protein BGX27_006845 [Mortierella sp. AM989]